MKTLLGAFTVGMNEIGMMSNESMASMPMTRAVLGRASLLFEAILFKIQELSNSKSSTMEALAERSALDDDAPNFTSYQKYSMLHLRY